MKPVGIPSGLNALTSALFEQQARTSDEFVLAPACTYMLLHSLLPCTRGKTHDELGALLTKHHGAEEGVELPEALASVGALKNREFLCHEEHSLWVDTSIPLAGGADSADAAGAGAAGSADANSAGSAGVDATGANSGGCAGLRATDAKDAASCSVSVQTLDMQADSALDTLDSWVSRATQGDITEAPGIPSSCVLAAFGAQALRAGWQEPCTETRSKKFFASDGSYKIRYLISWEESLVQECQAALVVGKRLEGGAQVVFALPHEGHELQSYISSGHAWKDFSAYLAAGAGLPGGKAKKNYQKCMVRLALPRLAMLTAPVRLADSLTGLGVKSLFNPLLADFGPLTPNPVCVGELRVCAGLSLHEEGIDGQLRDTTAGIANAHASALKTAKRRKIWLNRPFAFMVADAYNTPLYLGCCSHPSGV